MPLTPETLPRHELVGLHVRVVESDDPDRVGIEGRIVEETMRTLVVRPERDGSAVVGESSAAGTDDADDRATRTVPKSGTTFEFALTDEAAGDRKIPGIASEPAETAGGDVTYVTVDGARLLSRPATRTETAGDTIWQSD